MISKATIDKIFEASRVEEVLGDFVQLKKSGSNFKGLSPFSDERTPSFMVSPVKQIWKDFSSGKGGNVVAFLMEHEHFTYPEALKYLAKKYNIEVEETEQTSEQKEMANERESMFLVTEFASKYFQEVLFETEKGKAIGLSYFKERGFSLETIKKFNLGYSPDEWDALTSEALKKGYQLDFLEKTGLSIVKGEKQFDRFKGRVMFPIQSMSGRVLGFGGRILGEKTASTAKYLNSPESEIYHKSKVLYGLFHAKQAIAKEDNCFLVEGYTDVIQLNQAGIENVVSSSGTALSPEQIRLINRLTKNITVLFDSDAAGIRASLRGIDIILEQGMNVKVCTFPEGEDPDSFARKNTEEEIRLYLKENSKDFISFKASLLMEEAKTDPVKKAALIRDMVSSISKIPDAIQQEVYVQETARIMDISEEVLFSTLAQLGTKGETKKNRPTKKPLEVVREEQSAKSRIDELFEMEKTIISVLLLYGTEEEEFEDLVLRENEEGEMVMEPEVQKTKVFEKIFLDLQEDEIAFANAHFQEIYQVIISRLTENKAFQLDAFVNEMPPENSPEITNILMEEEQYTLHDWERMDIFVKGKKEGIGQLVSETILSLRRYLVSQKIDELNKEVKVAPTDKSSEILQDIMNYLSLKRILSNKLNRVM